MCGLFQIIERNRPVDSARLKLALDSMRHRGPDAEGLETSSATPSADGPPVAFGYGHRRLSILDLDPRSNQPFHRDGRTLLYNGEIYNFAELRRHPALVGVPFSTSGDTEVLIEALARRGTDLLREMSGMWAFVLTDEAQGTALAGRDRYGKKPLFFFFDDERMIFSSTIVAIFTYLGRRPVMRADALDSYLAHGVIYPGGGEATHLEGVGQVAPGGFLRFDIASWRMENGRWFDLATHVHSTPADPGDLPAILRTAVTSRLVSDRQVGLLLSGGIDSTLVLSVIHAAGLQDQVHCFIGETGRSDDALYAKKCVEQLGIAARTIELGYDSTSFERFLRMCRHQEKPFPLLGNSMAMSEMYEAIAQHDVPVVLDGTGGDEIFGGYWDRQYPFAIREAFRKRDWSWLRQAATQNAAIFRRTLREMYLERIQPRKLIENFLPHPSFAVAQFCSPDVRDASSADPLADTKLGFTEALIADADRGRLGEWIWQNDRNAMMASIENRSPLLDVRLSPYMKTGYAAKFYGAWNKHELRTAFDAFAPLPTQWRRQKQGFRWNARQFYAKNANAIAEIISASKVLPSRVNVSGFLDAARKNPRYFASRLSPRLLCIAGLEETIGLSPA